MKIGIVGLGLIGGSIFKKCCLDYETVGVSRSVVRENVSSNYSILCGCNLVFVCTPMNKTLEVLDKLENFLDENTLVTDVCSLKEFVSKKKYRFKFIPSHPMAGTEKNGWEHSFPELFEGASWAVTPRKTDLKEDIETLNEVITYLGAKMILTSPQEHDKAVALISHAPLVIAQALCKNIENNSLAQELASSGFRDTTRLALSNLEMANDMVLMNGNNIKDAIKLLNANLEELISGEYYTEASEIKQFREKLYL